MQTDPFPCATDGADSFAGMKLFTLNSPLRVVHLAYGASHAVVMLSYE